MSNAVSALQGASFNGAVTVTEMGTRGMISLRGDLSAAGVKKACTSVTGAKFPKARGIETKGGSAIAWMSPDEVLVMVPYGDKDATVAAMRKALGATHSLVVDVSDARAVFHVAGQGARDVLAKLTPADLRGFEEGEMRRTRLAQVPAAFHLIDAQTFEVVCFRSVAQYCFDILCVAASNDAVVGHLG